MPWKTQDQQEQRYELVRAMKAGEASVSDLSRRWHISRKTAYKWYRRYKQEGLRGLLDRARRPERIARRTSCDWLERVRRLRKKHPTWGARKLHHRLGQESGMAGKPAVSTISR
jgi:transposase